MTTFFDNGGRPIIPTVAMEDQLTQAASAIEAEYHGIGLHSSTRFGKSTLAAFICAYHAWQNVAYVAKHLDLRTVGSGEAAVFDWFLAQIGVRTVARQGIDQKLERIVSNVQMQLQPTGARRFMPIFDDANLLEADAFTHISTIDKALYKNGISFFGIFLFQDGHTSGKKEGINTLIVPPQIRSRYLTRYHRMHGIRGPDDLYVFLQRFEDEVEHSAGAGVSLPRHLAPSIYESKFRMCNDSARIWEEGCIQRVAARRSQFDDWPMKATSLIAYFLSTREICSPGFSGLTPEHIAEAVRFSDLALYNAESGEVVFSDDL